MQTEAQPYATASSHKAWICGQVASGFSRVWSTWEQNFLAIHLVFLLSALSGPF